MTTQLEKVLQVLQDNIIHECGIAGAFNVDNSAAIVRDLLTAQQERGEAGCGIGSFHKNKMFVEKGNGLVASVFPDDFNYSIYLPGRMAVGHNRYPTRGTKSDKCNLQPFYFKQSKFGEFMVLHNGQFINHSELQNNLISKGIATQSDSDSELAGLALLQSKYDNIEDAIKDVMPNIKAAYSLMFMTPDKIFALRDGFGVRPLSIAKYDEGFLISSETGAFRPYEKAKLLRDVKPGELLVFDKNNPEEFTSSQIMTGTESFCIMEGIYFSFPRSSYNGCAHEKFRFESGSKVYEENKDFFDFLVKQRGRDNIAIVPILNSGRQAAFGFSDSSGIKYREYFMRRTNISGSLGRSFTSSSYEERLHKAMMKLDLNEESVYGKTIITVDDSIVRGITSKVNNDRLWKAGATQVFNIIASPMIKNPCFLGIDYQTRKELASYNKLSAQEIAKDINSSGVFYLSMQGLKEVVASTYKSGICSGCFDGNYAVKRLT